MEMTFKDLKTGSIIYSVNVDGFGGISRHVVSNPGREKEDELGIYMIPLGRGRCAKIRKSAAGKRQAKYNGTTYYIDYKDAVSDSKKKLRKVMDMCSKKICKHKSEIAQLEQDIRFAQEQIDKL